MEWKTLKTQNILWKIHSFTFCNCSLGFVSCGEDDETQLDALMALKATNCEEQVNTSSSEPMMLKCGQLSGSIGGLPLLRSTQERKLPLKLPQLLSHRSRRWARWGSNQRDLPLAETRFKLWLHHSVEIVGEVRNGTEYYIPQTVLVLPLMFWVFLLQLTKFWYWWSFPRWYAISTLNSGGDFTGTIVMKGLK